ncbi:MAG TPA: hypothetical protein VK550_23680 [Polyangiaceae bacterium]|nr:hypothetical protein [Polyangiaceae bacterium]
MIRLRVVLWALWIGSIAGLASTPARAATPDARAVQGRLEDQLNEGEIDAEDFLAWHVAPRGSMGAARGAAYLGFEAFRVEKANGGAEWGATLILELPLERFARPHGLQAPPSPALFAGPADNDTGATWLGAAASEGSRGDSALGVFQLGEALPRVGIAESAPAKVERAAPAPIMTVTTEVARSCIRAALRTMGLADDQRIDSVAARARSSAALPELRLRAVRTLGETGRISLSEDDPSRYVASGAATNVLEARITFRLDRLLFADEEITVERARLDRTELRSRLAAKVLQALFEWQKAYALLQDSGLPAEDRFSAVLREAESSAVLDMMTGGWFGVYRAALAARAP